MLDHRLGSWAVAVALVIGVACSSAATNELGPEPASGVDYVAMGLPAADHPWTSEEHVHAAAMLARIAVEHRERLPRLDGSSAPVFSRLVEALPARPGTPIEARFKQHLDRYQATNALMKLYVPRPFAAPNREGLELMGALVHEVGVFDALVDPFVASFGPDDPKRAARLRGLTTMRAGWGGMLLGGLLIAGDDRLGEPDRTRLVTRLAPILLAVMPKLAVDHQRAIRAQLDQLLAGLAEGRLRDEVKAIAGTEGR